MSKTKGIRKHNEEGHRYKKSLSKHSHLKLQVGIEWPDGPAFNLEVLSTHKKKTRGNSKAVLIIFGAVHVCLQVVLSHLKKILAFIITVLWGFFPKQRG